MTNESNEFRIGNYLKTLHPLLKKSEVARRIFKKVKQPIPCGGLYYTQNITYDEVETLAIEAAINLGEAWLNRRWNENFSLLTACLCPPDLDELTGCLDGDYNSYNIIARSGTDKLTPSLESISIRDSRIAIKPYDEGGQFRAKDHKWVYNETYMLIPKN